MEGEARKGKGESEQSAGEHDEIRKEVAEHRGTPRAGQLPGSGPHE